MGWNWKEGCKKCVPQSMVARTIVVLILAVILSNLIVFGFHVKERHDVETKAAVSRVVERMVFPVGVLAGAASEQRAELAPSLQGRFRRVWISELPMNDGFAPPLGIVEMFGDALKAEMKNLGVTEVHFGLFEEEDMPRFRRGPGFGMRGMHRRHHDDDDDDKDDDDDDKDDDEKERQKGKGWKRGDWDDPDHFVVVSAGLAPGQWVNVATPFDPRSMGWKPRPPFGFFFTILLVIGVTVIIVMRVSKPIRRFTDAAERLGRDVNAPPLDEKKGPREVRRGARAFNEMQRRIRNFIEDRTRMLAAVSHDLRTPITRMRLRAEFVEDDEQREKMLKDLDEMESMIAATMAFAKEDVASEASIKVDLAALIAALADDMVETGDDVTYRGLDSLPFEGRPVALKRAFTNLITNAVKYGERARISLADVEGNAVITIEDDGPGIPVDHLDKVFAPFYRVEDSRNRETGGTGLGLSVVRSVVTAHGGEVTLRNGPEGGLKVILRLPIAN